MKMADLLDDIFESEAMLNLLDIIVNKRIQASRDMCVEERKRLDDLKNQRELESQEEQDWVCLVQDIAALDRVIDYYGG